MIGLLLGSRGMHDPGLGAIDFVEALREILGVERLLDLPKGVVVELVEEVRVAPEILAQPPLQERGRRLIRPRRARRAG